MIHPVIRVRRDADGQLLDVASRPSDRDGQPPSRSCTSSSTASPTASSSPTLKAEVEQVLADVRSAVEDWPAMRGRAQELAHELEPATRGVTTPEIAETRGFLRWLADNHFTFLGYREYELIGPAPTARRR